MSKGKYAVLRGDRLNVHSQVSVDHGGAKTLLETGAQFHVFIAQHAMRNLLVLVGIKHNAIGKFGISLSHSVELCKSCPRFTSVHWLELTFKLNVFFFFFDTSNSQKINVQHIFQLQKFVSVRSFHFTTFQCCFLL